MLVPSLSLSLSPAPAHRAYIQLGLELDEDCFFYTFSREGGDERDGEREMVSAQSSLAAVCSVDGSLRHAHLFHTILT